MTLIACLLGVIAPLLILHIGPKIPRQLAAETVSDFRFFQHQVSYPKSYSNPLKRTVLCVWALVMLIAIAIQPDAVFLIQTALFAGCLLLGALIDHHTGLLPFRVSYVLGTLGLYQAAIMAPDSVAHTIASGAVVYGLGTAANWLASRHLGHPVIGGGDIVFLTMLTTWFPLIGIAWTLWTTSITGLIEARLARQRAIRLGPHLAFGALSYWLGQAILS
jgi:prepilin signal peptidase PulO-like enzyme (type II secretory pathway)